MTFAEQMVEKIEALLLGKADNDIKNFEFNGKSLSKYSFDELIKLRDKFKAEVAAEKRAADLANGIKPKNMIKVRF